MKKHDRHQIDHEQLYDMIERLEHGVLQIIEMRTHLPEPQRHLATALLERLDVVQLQLRET